MSRLRIVAVLGLLGLAFALGPLAAACGSCCPQAAERAPSVSPGDCCDCGQSWARAPIPQFSALSQSAAPAASLILAGVQRFVATDRGGREFSRSVVRRSAASPSSIPTPRRL